LAGEQRNNTVENEEKTKKDEEELAIGLMIQLKAAEELAKKALVNQANELQFLANQWSNSIQEKHQGSMLVDGLFEIAHTFYE